MIVASISSATATPKPICWNMIRSPRAKPENTATMISAAPVMIRAVEPTPNMTASVVSPRLVVALADPAEQEHLVVHREPEEHGEEEQRHPRLDRVRLLEPEQVGAEALLEDEHEQAVRGADREQVEHDGRSGDDDRAEDDGQQDEGEEQHERDDVRRRVDDRVEVVDVLGATSRRRAPPRRCPRTRSGRCSSRSSRTAAIASRRRRIAATGTDEHRDLAVRRALDLPVAEARIGRERRAQLVERALRRPRRDAFETTISAGSVVVRGEVALERDEALLRDEAVGERRDAARPDVHARARAARARGGADRERRG